MPNAIRFNNKPLPSWVRVTGITFPVLPELEHREYAMPRRYGNIDSGVEIGGKTFSIDVTLLLDEENIHDKTQELKDWLKGSGWRNMSKLVFEESPDHYYLARVVSSVDVDDLFLYGEGSIEFRSSDGLRYSNTQSTHNFSGQSATVDYSGQEVAPVIFTVEFNEPLSDLTITHEQTDKAIVLAGNFQSGQKVVIDNNLKTVRLNGSIAMNLLTFESRWLYLYEGTNTFTIQSGGQSDLNIDVKMEYQKRN